MLDEIREHAEAAEQTAEWENPFVPAPLGDTVSMEFTWVPQVQETVP